ncbi:MAG: hypothetical protein K8J31_29830 [Anaerolineae bacterium]|nr:hypothetical protein [Anaerolineae bacterium]
MVQAIRIQTTIGEDRRLVIDLPPDTPIGPAELVIRPTQTERQETKTLTREEARAKLLAAGLLATPISAPEGTVSLSPEELLLIGKLSSNARPSEDLINEDRGEY